MTQIASNQKTRTQELYLRNPRNPRFRYRYIIFGCHVRTKSRMKIRKPAPIKIWTSSLKVPPTDYYGATVYGAPGSAITEDCVFELSRAFDGVRCCELHVERDCHWSRTYGMTGRE